MTPDQAEEMLVLLRAVLAELRNARRPAKDPARVPAAAPPPKPETYARVDAHLKKLRGVG